MLKQIASMAALLLCLTGCDDTSSTDGGTSPDSGAVDSGRTDAGGTDSGADDAGPGDAGPGTDAGPTDSGTEDAGTDAGPPDSGVDCTHDPLPALGITDIVSGDTDFTQPVFVAQAPGSSDTLWVIEKRGRIRLVRGGAILGTDFLDLRATIGSFPSGNDERGLLGMAFHPNYASNGRFFVFYTPTASGRQRDIVAEYSVSSNPDVANATEVRQLVDEPTLASNHNGGMIAFGPDGFLYVSMGDGGGSGDPFNTGQDIESPHGALLRLDVEGTAPFAASGNPFVGRTGDDRIWAYGLRNAWRVSFDADNGDLYIADVGQNSMEEIDIQPSTSTGGENYGWNAYEGTEVFDSSRLPIDGYVPPAVAYDQFSSSAVVTGGCSITGGYVYRGTSVPALDGWYLYSDYCSGDIGALRWCGGSVVAHERVNALGLRRISSFGQDNAGEVYITAHDAGRVYRITAE